VVNSVNGKTGKTTVLTGEQARELLDSIDTSTLIGLRDRALISVMTFAAVFRPGRVPVIGRFALAGETTVQRGFNAPMLLVTLAGHASGETTTSSDIIPRLSQAPGIATGIGRLVMSQHQFYELQYSVVCATTIIRLRHCPTKS
jgi:hypothetical protein